MFFVYIIESELSGDFYKGSTFDVVSRLKAHNAGMSRYTKSGAPWILRYLASFETRSEAMKEEKRLKRCNKDYLRWLISQPGNLLNNSEFNIIRFHRERRGL